MKKNRVVVTGLGVVSPIGIGKVEFAEGLKQGRIGIDRITFFDASDLPCQIAAEVRGFDLKKHLPEIYSKKIRTRTISRASQMAIVAAYQAIEDSSLSSEELFNVPVIVGTSGGGDFLENQYKLLFEHGYSNEISPYAITAIHPGMIPSDISRVFSMHGQSIALSNLCCSSTDAVGHAMNLITSGNDDIVLCGGVDAPIIKALMSFACRIGILATKYNDNPKGSMRPFDQESNGFVLGEGAWFFVLENMDTALKRKATILAELGGYGATCDADNQLVKPLINGDYAIKAIEIALKRAGLKNEDIDYVCAYGNSTKVYDEVELFILNKLFNNKKIQINSIKTMLGYTAAANGAAQVVASTLFMSNHFLTPKINNYNSMLQVDSTLVLDNVYNNDIKNILINSFGFGGKNSMLVLKKYE